MPERLPGGAAYGLYDQGIQGEAGFQSQLHPGAAPGQNYNAYAQWQGANMNMANGGKGGGVELGGSIGGGIGGGGGGGGGRGGGGGGGHVASPSEIQALQTLYAQYQKHPDQGLTNNLNHIVAQATNTGTHAINDLISLLNGQKNPYAGMSAAAPVVAENPMAQYMSAGGQATSGVDALHQLLQASGSQMQHAQQQHLNETTQAWNNGHQGQLADAHTSGTAFHQALANQNSLYQAQVASGEQKRKDALMSQILQMAVSSGADLTKLGIKF